MQLQKLSYHKNEFNLIKISPVKLSIYSMNFYNYEN